MFPSERVPPAAMRLLASSATKGSTTQKAESIRYHGLIQPITVRPNAQGFEVIAGARRFRAAQLAELFSVPARIVEIDDAQVLEWQLVELSIVGKSFLCLYATWHVVYMQSTCRAYPKLLDTTDIRNPCNGMRY
jgi:ParB-like nuclease domain